MTVDFGKIFGCAFRYPIRKDVFLLMLFFNLIIGLLSWFVVGYFMGDVSLIQGGAVLSTIISSMIYLIPVAIVNFFVMIFLLGLYVDNSMHFFKGKIKHVSESMSVAKQRFMPLLATTIILILIFFASFGGLLLLFFSVTMGSELPIFTTIIAGIWILVGVVVGSIVLFMTSLSTVFCVLDETGPLDSLRSSWNLIIKNKGNTFIFGLIFAIISMIISTASSMPETVFSIFYGTPEALSLQSLVFLIIGSLFSVYMSLFAFSAETNFYLSIKKKTLPI